LALEVIQSFPLLNQRQTLQQGQQNSLLSL
jgi:hypothetical protein